MFSKKHLEKDLEDAKIAARNVLDDLQDEQRKLIEAKAKDEALLDSIGEGVVATDQRGNVTVVNKTAEQLLGLQSNELTGKPFIQAFLLEDSGGNRVPVSQRPITMALTEGKSTNANYIFVRVDDTKIPVAITATPVLLDAKPSGAIIVFRDITKEKEIEKLRTDFLSLASHQLRTPLSGTKWLIETLKRGITGVLNPKQKEYIDNLYKINERMINLVADMLNVLMLESGAMETKKEEIGAGAICAELMLMMEPAAKNKGVVLHNAFKDKKEIFILSDFQIVRSILESFVGNAINYSKKGREVILDVTEDPSHAIFFVQDGGIGIPFDEQKRIFERFYRSSNAKDFKPDGTGLGLYTAFLLAQKIGGKISFKSEENKGATFYLRIPLSSS